MSPAVVVDVTVGLTKLAPADVGRGDAAFRPAEAVVAVAVGTGNGSGRDDGGFLADHRIDHGTARAGALQVDLFAALFGFIKPVRRLREACKEPDSDESCPIIVGHALIAGPALRPEFIDHAHDAIRIWKAEHALPLARAAIAHDDHGGMVFEADAKGSEAG